MRVSMEINIERELGKEKMKERYTK